MKSVIKMFVALGVVGYMVSCSPKSSEGTQEEAQHEHVHKGAYSCPMKCEKDKTYDKEGECPVCHMELVKE